MCGIVGIHTLGDSTPIDPALLRRMNDALVHRGPDSAGSHETEPGIALAMRRLAIIDVSGGDQPISNEDESIWVVYNGEIYNFETLREELEGKGHVFRTHTDTEVLVHAYEEFGDDFPQRLRGMFAFALWDSRRQRLLLVRDRVGIKQLFFTRSGGSLIWGSEIKAILQHPGVERRLRPAAANHFLTYLYVPAPLTMFEGIEELEPAHMLVVERGRIEKRRYWRLRYEVRPEMTADEAATGLREHLDEAVRLRLISDVPLGAFLSGGIDSASVVALMARHSNARVNTFSIGYASGGEAFDETRHARRLAERYGTNHVEFTMRPDLVRIVSEIVHAFDQPNADSTAIPTWYLCKETRSHVTVALSGLGGDEIAAGYERYRGALLGERLRWLPRWLVRGALAPAANLLPDPRSGHQWAQRVKRFVSSLEKDFDDRYFDLIAQLSRGARESVLTPEMCERIDLDEPHDVYRRWVGEVAEAAPLNRALYADLGLYLPGDLLTLTDRISMAHSLEVRVPFLDHVLLEYAATIPPALKLRRMEKKHVLKRAVADLLPEDFLRRRKMGFSAPVAVWFRNELREFVEDTLAPARLAAAGVFEPGAVRRILDDHFERRANYDNQIWALIVFTVWHRDYLETRDAVPLSRY